MRGLSLGILMIVAVATVLVFSIRSLSKDRRRLLQEFADGQAATARELASDLENRLQDLEEDARVIAALVEREKVAQGGEAAARERALRASFDALASVVRHYRSLALLGGDGGLRVLAIDPTEDGDTAAALTRMSQAAAEGQPRGARRLTGPVAVGGGGAAAGAARYFYLYAFPIGADDTVVIALDAPRFLQSAALRAIPDARVVVVDPSGTPWAGCAAGSACVPSAPRDEAAVSGRAAALGAAGPSGVVWLDAAAVGAPGAPGASAVAAWATIGWEAVGSWRVRLAVSAAAVQSREQALERQLLATSTALLVAIGLVGILIVRQQRYSAALAERLRNAETLSSLERQLIRAEKLATTGVLAAGIAHEVGTPLGIIRARAEMLIDQLDPGAGTRRPLDTIVQQIDRISSTIRQVLDFSRAQPVELGRLEPGAAARAVLDLLEHRFRQQDVAVEADVAPQAPAMAADASQLQQVLVNILLNACDACGRGGHIRVAVRPAEDPAFVRWDIRDDGAGVAPEHLLAVFDPFFTTKKRGEGTGLGLPVATSIVRNHGGEITLSSTPGEGTTVSILWPAAKSAAKEGEHVQG